MIRTAHDPPETLDVLRDRAQSKDSEGGYQDHHIVGQHEQNRRQFGDAMIDSYENMVRLPTVKHIEISRWYATRNDEYGGLSPRDYLRNKSWDEQMRLGLQVLRDKGVTK